MEPGNPPGLSAFTVCLPHCEWTKFSTCQLPCYFSFHIRISVPILQNSFSLSVSPSHLTFVKRFYLCTELHLDNGSIHEPKKRYNFKYYSKYAKFTCKVAGIWGVFLKCYMSLDSSGSSKCAQRIHDTVKWWRHLPAHKHTPPLHLWSTGVLAAGRGPCMSREQLLGVQVEPPDLVCAPFCPKLMEN